MGRGKQPITLVKAQRKPVLESLAEKTFFGIFGAVTWTKKNKRDFWAVERILSRLQVTDKDLGKDGKLKGQKKKDFIKLWRSYQESPDNLRSRAQWLLTYEYGHLLPNLIDARFSLEEVPVTELYFAAQKHAQNLDQDALSSYSSRHRQNELLKRLPQGVVFQKREHDTYRVVDGYHRLSAAKEAAQRFVLVVVARPR